MMRRLLLVTGGSGSGGPAEPTPTDPTLTKPRLITRPFSMNQNVFTVAGGSGTTWQEASITVLDDAADMTLLFHGGSQGTITDPTTIKVAIKRPGTSTFTPVTFAGDTTASLPLEGIIESDVIAGPFLEGATFQLRVWAAGGQTINIAEAGTTMTGDHTTETVWVPSSEFSSAGPTPLAFIGRARANVVSVGVFGDSIAAQGQWFRTAAATNTLSGVNFGRNVQTFNGRWLNEATVRGLTHMLVQFSVNDLGPGPSVAGLWANAVACYAYVDGLKPGLLIWQTTPTPTVQDTAGDQCATLAGQTLDQPRSTARQAWIAFLRDGAPCHPDTKAALTVGATGLRAGQDGHPLRGIVDIAAAVEQGGLAGTGKWRVDLGPLGGDGVHPSSLGESIMAGPTSEWMATLTA